MEPLPGGKKQCISITEDYSSKYQRIVSCILPNWHTIIQNHFYFIISLIKLILYKPIIS